MPAQLICITGIDGSGKSSLALNLCRRLEAQGLPARVVHAYHEPRLLRPAKQLARLLFLKKTDALAGYAVYRRRKAQASSQHPALSRLYGGLWLCDYSLQALFSVSLPALQPGILILDRYIYDTLINQAVTLNWPHSQLERAAAAWLRIYPTPQRVFLVDLPEEAAFARKTDIPSLEYLRERRGRYRALAQSCAFTVLDGLQAPDALLNNALEYLTISPAPGISR